MYLYSRGFSIFEIAIFEGIFHITSILMEIPTGIISDLFGRKTSRILGVLSYLVYIAIILNSNEFYVIAIGFVFCSLSYVFESGAAEAIVYDSLIQMDKEEEYMRVSGIKEAIFQVSGFVALMISGSIGTENPEYNFYLTGIFFLIGMILIISMREVPIKKSAIRSVKEQFINQFVVSTKTVLRNKRLFLLIVIGGLITAPVTTIFFFLQNYFDIAGVSWTLITVYLGLHAGAAAIGGIFAHKLEKKFKERKILLFVPLFMTVLFWLILFESYMVIPFIILGFLESIFYVVLIDYINKMISSEERSTVLSFFGMVFSIVMIFVFTTIGYVIENVSFRFAFIILAMIVTMFYIGLLFVIKGNHLNEENKQ